MTKTEISLKLLKTTLKYSSCSAYQSFCKNKSGGSHIDDIIAFADFDWLSIEAAILMTSFRLQILIGCPWKWPYWWHHSVCRFWLVVHGSGHIDDIIPFAYFDWLSMKATILMTELLLQILIGCPWKWTYCHFHDWPQQLMASFLLQILICYPWKWP